MDHVILLLDELVDLPNRRQLSVLLVGKLLEELALLWREIVGIHEAVDSVG